MRKRIEDTGTENEQIQDQNIWPHHPNKYLGFLGAISFKCHNIKVIKKP
jgi:hypothetical protein